ncbi:hypothetical protein [Patulibacter sp. SYSU D01012]|uniref:hypothetical protein n=1 Tax=Patulibacter sp. SYSU D01012 TaxID=2817381 RepID=UPI001B303E86|nr:hypothetical protein [Patulibacter sp. SYSU D01012]
MSTSPFLPADDPRAGRCAACGVPMAADQRYCLSCGARRDGARLPFQDALVPVPAPGPAVPAVPPALWYPPQSSGVNTTTILAALACVLVAFGVGLLVGGDGDGDRPVVVGAAPAAAAPAAAAPAATTTEDAAATEDDADDDAGKDDAKADESTIPDTPLSSEDEKDAEEVSKIPAKVPKAEKVDDSVAKKLTSKDPDEAREASQALPDVVSTGE